MTKRCPNGFRRVKGKCLMKYGLEPCEGVKEKEFYFDSKHKVYKMVNGKIKKSSWNDINDYVGSISTYNCPVARMFREM